LLGNVRGVSIIGGIRGTFYGRESRDFRWKDWIRETPEFKVAIGKFLESPETSGKIETQVGRDIHKRVEETYSGTMG